MKTPIDTTTRAAEIRAKAEAEIRKMEAGASITDALSTVRAPDSVFVHPLYGKEATAKFGGEPYGNPEYLTPEDVATLAEAFPPLPLLLRKDGCTSFPLESWYDALPEDKQTGGVAGVAPFLLVADFTCCPQYGHRPKVWIEWVAMVAGMPVEIEAHLNPHDVLSYRFDAKNRRNAPRDIVNTILDFRGGWALWAGDNYPALHHPTGGDQCERMARIQWGRGSNDCGHRFTFYSGCYDAELPHWMRRVAALGKAMVDAAADA